MENLKKCPFCGNKDITAETDKEIEVLDEGEETGYFAVVCNYNDGGCGATSGYRETKEEAIKIWNRRA